MEFMFSSILLLQVLFLANSDYPIFSMAIVKQGEIVGTTMRAANNREIYAFRGIPYAKPPINQLRFQLPVPAGPWQGRLQSTHEVISCPQMNRLNQYLGTEDCLVLNVYVPKELFLATTKNSHYPVMVYIHGGGFVRDSGMESTYSPTKLLDKDVLLVTLNYRLGGLGFLSSGDEVIPGNLGLHDQVEALKWVQENIRQFKGDPSRVTIFGQSAGATAVSLHLISPKSRNLFQAAIVQSGTYYGLRSFSTNPRKWAKRLAMKLKCPSVTMQQLLECLKTKSPKELSAAPDYFQLVNQIPKIFGTVSDKRPESFLPFDPLQNPEKVKIEVPIMIGTMAEEGYFLYSAFENYFQHEGQEFLDRDFPVIFQGLNDIHGNIGNYAKAIADIYFKNVSKTDSKQFTKAMKNLYADFYNDIGTERFLSLPGLQSTPVYLYKFSHRGDVCNVNSYNCTNPGNRGPSHGEELPYLFPFQNMSEIDSQFSKAIIDLWTNFATHHNPTPSNGYESFQWLPTSSKDPKYLDLDLKPKMVSGHITYNVKAWDEAMKAIDCPSQESSGYSKN